uniref:Serpin domain-containing protein n=3 Tax=Scleropages formosus TaxID=113540 RepID=A0A8C9WNG9_SCLFO
MKSFLCVIASIVLAGVCASPASHDGDPSGLTKEHMDHLHHDKDHPHPHNLAEDKPVSALASHNADFAFALYKQLSSQEDTQAKNIFFSPLSISSALSMVALGAKGATHQELFKTLGYSEIVPADVNDAYEHIFHSLGHSQSALQLDTGNAMVLQEKFKPKHKFVEDAKHYFDAEGFTVDFNMPDEAAKNINQYIAKKTHDKITDMISDLDKNTVMMLINYIYFRGKWEKPFEASLTEKADFHVDETTKVSVDMMKRTGRYDYYYDITNKTTVLMIPYQGNASMMVVLPDEGQMKKVESVINKDYIKHWHDSLFRSNVELSIPKFSASVSYTLTDTLKEMGLVSVFDDEADLSGISEEVGLKVSKVAHKAVLSVDEKGTEAAGVTTVEIMPMSTPDAVHINRPFFIFILEESTKSILFMGKITDPTAQ